ALIFAHPDFWPIVVAQSALTAWMLALTLRALGFDGRPTMLPAVAALLSALTTLPWIASILLTDIFAGLAVLALYLLVFARDARPRGDRTALLALTAFAVPTHSAPFAVLVALVLATAIMRAALHIGSLAG